jgi:predicted DNA-binding protein
MSKNKNLNIRCSEETILQLAELARLEKRTVADVVRLLIESAWVEKCKVMTTSEIMTLRRTE